MITTLVNRDNLGHWLNENGLGGVGVEIGTYKGELAYHLASTWNGKVHTCDPWTHRDEYVDGCVIDFNGMKKLDLEALRLEAIKRLEPLGDKVSVHRCTGAEILGEFAAGSLSFVFCDGDHSYDTVKKEFTLAWDKLRCGGVLGTHDCYHRHDDLQHCGVWDAVWEFSHLKGIKPHLTFCTSAWFVKP